MQAANLKATEDGRRSAKIQNKMRNPLSPPTTVDLSGVRVHFPFRPYECQRAYMATVLEALLKSENALLESPTGTGKTLCLLCATLAWQRQQARLLRQASEIKLEQPNENLMTTPADGPTSAARVPTIIYASRTHSQLSQVVRELRNTRYRPLHAVLGSREQMCVNPKIKKPGRTASDINHDCNRLGKERKCRFRNNLEGFSAPSNESCGVGNHTQSVRDLEDLVTMGKEHSICPFYYTREQIQKAELVLVPYNYLFDKDARQSTLADIPWDNAVVIFDEAHNLEAFASESSSFDLTTTDIAGCAKDLQRVVDIIQMSPEMAGGHIKIENVARIKRMLLQLEVFILNLGPQTAYNGEFMMDIFKQGCGITHINHELFIDELRKVSDLLMDMRGGNARAGSRSFEHFIQCLKRVFGFTLESRCVAKANFYRVHVSPRPPPNQTNNASRTISYWCFAPSLAMEELAGLKIRSILVTSGTLSPLSSYGIELGLPFPHTLENPHIIRDEQIHVRVVGRGVSGKVLSSSYERRKDKDYYVELGNTLVSLAKVIPAGMLVFFPSYSVMEACLENWGGPASSHSRFENQNSFFAKRQKPSSRNAFSFPYAATLFAPAAGTRTTPWKRLLSTKSVVVEPKSSSDLADAISEFTKFLAMPKSPGCILMGVCRGKISEGIDFANEQSRAVVITGLPFPPSHDPKVKMKREYLDGARALKIAKASADGGFGERGIKTGISGKLSGHEWYQQQAHRAVNQAIGRVIRNQADYGAVLLLDSRFGQPHNQIGLSKWLRPHIQNDEGFGPTVRSLAQFYKTAEMVVAQQTEAKNIAQSEQAKQILEYEEDDDPMPEKVALIRRPGNENEKTHVDDEVGSTPAYIDPTQVIARISVHQLDQNCKDSSKSKTAPMESFSNLAPKTNDAVFGITPKSSRNDSKQLAVQFMARVKEKLHTSDQSTIRKAIIDMKSSGEKRDAKAYLKSAKVVVDIVVRCEPFESCDANNGPQMLLLLFGLLPKAFREQVELMSFALVFNASSFGSYCRDMLVQNEFMFVRSAMGRLLQLLWCRKSGIPLPTEEYLRKAKDILDKLYIAAKPSSAVPFLSAYLKLIPANFRNATRTFAAERNAAVNVQKLKAADKLNQGENSVDVARFKVVIAKTEPLEDSKNLIFPPNNPTHPKRKVEEPHAEPKKKTPIGRRELPDVNERASKAVRRNDERPTSKAASIASILQMVEAEALVQKSITTTIKSNAPDNIMCSVCANVCKVPILADCGHMACLSCWTSWLKRSHTCMVCRAKTSDGSLARVVYERHPGRTVPATLSQLCGDDDEGDSEDELEICK